MEIGVAQADVSDIECVASRWMAIVPPETWKTLRTAVPKGEGLLIAWRLLGRAVDTPQNCEQMPSSDIGSGCRRSERPRDVNRVNAGCCIINRDEFLV